MSNPSPEAALQATVKRIDDLANRFLDRIFWRKEASDRPKVNRPWESWELDEQFFQTLSRWTLDNPETSLDRILDRIRDHVEIFQDFMQAIPVNPFPARSLVIALAHLLKLGATVRRAQKDVQDFAKDVIQWVGLVKSSFESADDQRFTRRAWHDLKHMCELVDKICLWAVQRLHDGRWLQIGHGLMIQKEIGEFNERIANARALFQNLSAINMARGLDAIMQKLRTVVLNQQSIIREIQMLRKTQEKQFDQLMSEKKMEKQVAERERFFARTLDVHAITSPTYDSQGKRPCDSDTRVDVLDEIRKWRNDIKRGSQNFLWLTGDPGCGKSAVTASFARECKDEGVLWAQFFINRNNAETTDPRSYFPSIARQLADYSPEVAQAIHLMLVHRRSLTDDISADQAAFLFTSSICKASELDPNRPIVVVIDGLDETKHDRLEDTAQIFSTLFNTLRTHGNVKVFISSRTENEIQKSFILPDHEKRVKRLHLNTAHPSSIRDVSMYIKRNLLKLVEKYDLNWAVWPGDERSQVLGQRASGLFIWGVTAVKFIEDQLFLYGNECLDDVLDMLTAEVLDDINALYMLILDVAYKSHRDDWGFESFRRVVGAIVFLQEPLCIDDLAALIDLRKKPSSRPVDIAHFVRRLRTILVTGTDTIDGKTIPRIHKSVFEFITSTYVDPKFRVDPEFAHLELALQCLGHLGAAPKLVTMNTLPMPFRYASRFWLSHLSQANALGFTSICADYRRSSSPSLLSLAVPPTHNPTWVQHFLTTSQIHIGARIWDAVNGISIPHTDKITCVVFSPDGKQIVSCSGDKSIKAWDCSNGEWIRTLATHSSEFNAIAFSPSGESIISGSNDGLVHLWEYLTGAPIAKPFQRHEERVTCIAFSNDGKWVVSGSDDKTCILWDVESKCAVGGPWTGFEAPLRSVAFSGSSRRVCSLDDSGCYIVWDVFTGQKITHWDHRKFLISKCLSFSPKDDDVVALGGRHGIKILSHDREWWVPDSDDTCQLSLSPDGKEIVFSTEDTISVAEIGKDESSTRVIRTGNYHCAGPIAALAFSPKSNHFAYADESYAIHLFALQHGKASLKLVPVKPEAVWVPHFKDGGAKGLQIALSNMKKAQRIHDAVQTTNRRLCEMTWYEVGLDGGPSEPAVKICVLRDNVVIAGYKDGSVCVWDQHGEDHT